MNKLKHTPGPWTACRQGECECGFIHGEEHIVAVTQHGFDDLKLSKDVWEANARLIAAAPEMLDALIYFVKRVREGSIRSKKTYSKYVAIIEKAIGLEIEEVLK